MKRKFIKIVTALSTLFLSATLFFGCNAESSSGKSILSIAKTGSEGLTDYYTITYTDGTTDSFMIRNGENGQQGESISVEALYVDYLEQYPDASFEEFLSAVISVSVDETATAISKALKSSLQVYAEFTEKTSSTRPPFTATTSKAVYMGSAVIYSIESDYTYLITNYHVIYDANAATSDKIAERIVCYLYGSEGQPTQTSSTTYDYGEYGIECEYVGGSASSDLAIIKTETDTIKAINEDIAEIEFAQ